MIDESEVADSQPDTPLTPITISTTSSSSSSAVSAKSSANSEKIESEADLKKISESKISVKSEIMNEKIACALCAQIFHSEDDVKSHVDNEHSELNSQSEGSKLTSPSCVDDSKHESTIKVGNVDEKTNSHNSPNLGSLSFAVDNLIQKGDYISE